MIHFFVIWIIDQDMRFTCTMHLATVIISTFDILEGDARYRRLIGKPRRGFEGLLIGLLLIQHEPSFLPDSQYEIADRSQYRCQLPITIICVYAYTIYISGSSTQYWYLCIIYGRTTFVLLIFPLYTLYLKNEGFTKKLNWQK